MDKNSETWRNLQRFANEHKLILQDEGEVGFGRPCVGFLGKSGNYVDYNPLAAPDYLDYAVEYDERLVSPVKDAYHKHDCMAVLVHGEDYDAALEQLNEWIVHVEAQGAVEVIEYETGATGLQAFFSGIFGYAITLKEKADVT